MYLRPLRNLDPGKLFHRQDVTVVVNHPGEVVYAAAVGHELFIGPVFAPSFHDRDGHNR